ncbi:unnamed protein product [Heligmosomoides polygyrus]|uniref:Adenylosuccinate synthetase n=1 Tax=Heligmosomoides polygyrus TaxID=6339 RepID=A0A183FCA5_HELPZ|nr:unnamed protein product [Heligmosomoides polygyrus]
MSPGVGVVSVLLGAQWGDEGKGKIIDYLIENNDLENLEEGKTLYNEVVVECGGVYFSYLAFIVGLGEEPELCPIMKDAHACRTGVFRMWTIECLYAYLTRQLLTICQIF